LLYNKVPKVWDTLSSHAKQGRLTETASRILTCQ